MIKFFRKINNTTQGYYHQLLKDLNKDKAYVEKTISSLDSMNNNYKSYLETFKKENLSLNET
jgi:hypothetical protein